MKVIMKQFLAPLFLVLISGFALAQPGPGEHFREPLGLVKKNGLESAFFFEFYRS